MIQPKDIKKVSAESLLYLSSIVVASWLVSKFGIINFLGLSFPAGAVVIGLTFSARDYVQKKHGKWGCWFWMVIACLITYMLNPLIALASVSAFALSEFVDWAVYTYSGLSLKKRIFISNVLSTPIDSIIFVVLVFGWNPNAVIGQTIVKFTSSLVVLAIKEEV